MAPRKPRLAVIRASEIGEYVYCSRSWWLRRVMGRIPSDVTRLDRGVVLHRRHGRALRLSGALLWIAALIAAAAIVAIVVAQR